MRTSFKTGQYDARSLPYQADDDRVLHGQLRVWFVARVALVIVHIGLGSVHRSDADNLAESSQRAASQTSSALHRAAARGDAKTVKLLLTRGADVNAQDDQGRTALLVAIERRHIDARNTLLDHGADVEKQTPSGISPLYAAAFHGRDACIEVLIDHGANVNARCALGRTALFPAAAEGHASCVRALLKRGADVTLRAKDGELVGTPLHGAAVEGQVETARVLLDHGVDSNALDKKWNITPLYLATVLGHEDLSALLTNRGADPSIADVFGKSPATAASLMAKRSTRQLATVADWSGRLNPRAIVYLVYLGRTQRGYRLKGARLAFAIGDGRYLITAAHCVDDFRTDSGEAIAKPLLISPHYGDLFEAEVVAVDHESDVAILRASWQTHPSLKLASAHDVAQAEQMAVAGYPPHPEKGRLSGNLAVERLSAIDVDPTAAKRAICLSAARFVGPGWSGSPMVLPRTAKVAGVFSSHDLVQVDQKVILHNLYGCDVQAILRLLLANGIDVTAAAENGGAENSTESNKSFVLLLRFFERFMQGDVDGKLEVAQQLMASRPVSPQIRLLVALAGHEKLVTTQKKDDRARQTADENFQESIRLLAGDDSTFVRTAYGCFLLFDGRPDDATDQLREARRLAPRDTFIGMSLLRALTACKSEEALALGEAICQEHPQSHQCWFEYAGAQREFGKFNEAVEAAENSIRSGGPNFYRGRLASVLAKAGRLNEAEFVYEKMIEVQPHEGTFWLWYARFLIHDCSEQQDKARRALDHAEQYSTPRTVPRAVIEELRKQLDAK
jgi:ankyrin repeat protein/tetratricopeptide (TPR) repeat protein